MLMVQHHFAKNHKVRKQAEAEVMPSSSLVEFDVEIGVEVEVEVGIGIGNF